MPDLRTVPTILCLETATKLCSVALTRDGQLLSFRDEENDKHVHAEKVNVFIDAVMHETGIALTELDAMAVGTGPGSYTGLRIGLSAAKGLCYALGIPIIGISTLRTLYESARLRHPDPVGEHWPMIDARRMEVFTQRYAPDGRPLAAEAPLILDDAWAAANTTATVYGDGADKASALWDRNPGIVHRPGIRPHAAAMRLVAEARFAANAFDDVAYLVPTYGKGANVTQPRKGVHG